jgi:hypothetical protein
VHPSHQQIQEYPETFSFRQPEDGLEYERKLAYQQLSANDPSQHEKQYFPAQDNLSHIEEAPPIPMASKPTSGIKSPTIRPITYTQQFETMSPMTSPMMSPARSPVINPVRDHSGHVGFFGRGLSNAKESLSSRTATPEQPQPTDKKEKRKSRRLLKRGMKG